jgi:hypothetical protein
VLSFHGEETPCHSEGVEGEGGCSKEKSDPGRNITGSQQEPKIGQAEENDNTHFFFQTQTDTTAAFGPTTLGAGRGVYNLQDRCSFLH